MRKALLLITIGSLLLASCGGRGGEPETASPRDLERVISLPQPVPAVPAYVVRPGGVLSKERVQKARRARGVAVVAPIELKNVAVDGPRGRREMTVGLVEPLKFRSVAASPTRDASFVWTSLMEGEAVVDFEAADDLGLGNSGTISLPNASDVEVGAFADTGAPGIADVLLADHVGERVSGRGATVLVVGAEAGADFSELKRALGRLFPGARLEKLAAPSASVSPTPQPTAAPNAMTYRILKNGFVEPDPAWVRANIATGSVPILGNVTCHRIVFPQLAAALAEVERAGLANEIDPSEYGGCYVPRFIDRDPRNALSMHAFGLAVDLNVATNQLGTAGDIDGRVVQIFERWGFEWGGRWSRPDPMHFELVRLIQP